MNFNLIKIILNTREIEKMKDTTRISKEIEMIEV